MEVNVEVKKGISFRKTNYLRKILKRFQIVDCKFTSVFIDQKIAKFLFAFKQQADRVTINWY